MKLHEPTANDAERIQELTRSAMTTSYSLSPQQIDNVIDEEFSEERMTDLVGRSDGYVFALEDEEFETLVGVYRRMPRRRHGGDTMDTRRPRTPWERRRQGVARNDGREVTRGRRGANPRENPRSEQGRLQGSLPISTSRKREVNRSSTAASHSSSTLYTLDATEREAADDKSRRNSNRRKWPWRTRKLTTER